MSDAPTVHLTTLGCAKNQVDSDKIVGLLTEAGYGRAVDPSAADVVVVNTCAFVEEARRESVETILELAEAKRSEARLVVVGCMAQRYGAELAEALPEADAVIGIEGYPGLVDRLDALTGWQPLELRPLRRPAMDLLFRTARPTPSTPWAYVKVAEGCDKACSFCAIPQFRGRQRSRPPTEIRREIEELVAGGVTEVVLVAQDLASYGRDLGAPGGIVDLLRFVADVEGLGRLRLFYLYPRDVRNELVETMIGLEVVADYFDLSLQHVVPELLRAMRRPGDGTAHLGLVEAIRRRAPEAAFRSSFIVGFPGETDDHVEALATFLREARLDWAGFFPFSPEEGTPAATLEPRIPDDEVAARLRHLEEVQEEITRLRAAEQVGRVLEVLVDQVEDGVPVGRSYREAPEIDGVVVLDVGEPGTWCRVEITGSYGHDLVGRRVEP